MDTIDLVVELLDKKGISGAKMSRDLGFSNAVFSQWKSGAQNPSMKSIIKMANYFGVSVEYLLGNEQKEKPAGFTDEQLKQYNEIMSIYNQLSDDKKIMAKNILESMLKK